MTKKVEPGAFAEFERELHERLMESDSTKLGALVAATFQTDVSVLANVIALKPTASTRRRASR